MSAHRQPDQPTLDRLYSPSTLVDDLPGYLRRYAELSARARRDHAVLTGLSYGDDPAELLDFFPAARPDAPLLVFVHGGYWQELGKDDSSFAAPGFLAAGAAFAALGYGLAPEYRLDEIVAMVRRALRWLTGNAAGLGVDPRAVFVAGTSAGAHLALTALCVDPSLCERVAGAILLSGVYDLRPLVRTYVNDALRLTESAALRNSPLLRLPAHLPPIVLARGGVETTEFIRQHEEIAVALTDRTLVKEVVSVDRNHFDLPFDLADPATELGRTVLARLGLRTGEGVVR